MRREREVVEYDGYVVPPQGEDTPENRKLREQAMKEFKERAKRVLAEAKKKRLEKEGSDS